MKRAAQRPVHDALALAIAVAGLAGILACGAQPVVQGFPLLSRPGELGEVRAGALNVMSYNVAGLLEPLSASHPAVNSSLISPHLNALDLVLVQEDFYYHADLARQVELPYHGPTDPRWNPFRPGDGLCRFSRFAFADHQRQTWTRCHGVLDSANDCLTDKGFAVSWTELAPGVFVDVYNLHLDAGSGSQDEAARAAQVQQLLGWLRQRSADRALIVAGDSNLDSARDADRASLQQLVDEGGLSDACASLDCGDERIDRVWIRSSEQLQLQVRDWRIPDDFVDAAGEPLSDHEPVVVRLGWQWR